MEFYVVNRPKLPRNKYGWVSQNSTISSNSNNNGNGGGDGLTINQLNNLFLSLNGGNLNTDATIGFSKTDEDNNVLSSTLGYDEVNWLEQAKSWFYWSDEDESVHCAFPFVSDFESSAYGNGNESEEPEPQGGFVTYNGQIVNELIAGNNVFFGIANGKLTINATSSSESGEQIGTDTRITDQDIANWNVAFGNTHTHTNKSILDQINQKTLDDLEAVQELLDYFYKDENGIVHSKYDFTSDGESSAFGKGDSETPTPSDEPNIAIEFYQTSQFPSVNKKNGTLYVIFDVE